MIENKESEIVGVLKKHDLYFHCEGLTFKPNDDQLVAIAKDIIESLNNDDDDGWGTCFYCSETEDKCLCNTDNTERFER